MKQITKYQSYTGREFDQPEACEKYEANCRIADRIIAQLPPQQENDGCNFDNGGGYIQHHLELFQKVRRELLQQANSEFTHIWFTQSMAGDKHPSWAARLIDESCTEQLRKAWYRIYCTDTNLREWGQPYYAANPGSGKDRRLN